MTMLWTWGGIFFGYRYKDSLYTHDGRHVGQFDGPYIYGPHGRYIGEVMNDRLIVDLQKRNWVHGSWAPYANFAPIARYADYAGYAMYTGFQDFPPPEQI